MKAVNTEKLLRDFEDLEAKKEQRINEIQQAATAFAISRGYDVERTAEFVKYVCENEGGGLNDAEKAKYFMLGAYIYDVEETNNDGLDVTETAAQPIE